LDRIKENIEKYYINNGYADGQVKEIYYKDGGVVVEIHEGKLYIVDSVLVEGNDGNGEKMAFLKFYKR